MFAGTATAHQSTKTGRTFDDISRGSWFCFCLVYIILQPKCFDKLYPIVFFVFSSLFSVKKLKTQGITYQSKKQSSFIAIKSLE